MILFIISSLVLALLIGIVYFPKKAKNVSNIPGLKPRNKKDGNLPELSEAGSFPKFLKMLHGKFGGIAGFYYGSQYCVSLSDEKYFKDIMSLFDRPFLIFSFVESLLGRKSIQFANGDDGKRRHKIYSEQFSQRVIVNELLPPMNGIIKELIEKWRNVEDGEPVPLFSNMMALAIRMITKTQYGTYFRSDEKSFDILHAYQGFMSELDDLMIGKFTEKSDQPRYDKLQNEIRKVKDMIQDIINHQREAKESGDYENAPFLNCVLENGSDEEEMVSDAITFFVGGFHTTGTFMTWALYYMAMYPKMQDKVRAEIQTVLKDCPNLEEQHLPHLKYLTQVLEECLRFIKTGPFAARISEDRSVNIGGHEVPPGTPIIIAICEALDNVRVFRDPEKFDPERFSDEKMKKINYNNFPAFGLGSRQCPGYRFSRMETLLTVVQLVRNFEFELNSDEDLNVEIIYGIVTKPESEIYLKMKKIN